MSDTIREDFEAEVTAGFRGKPWELACFLAKDGNGNFTDEDAASDFVVWQKAHARYAPKEKEQKAKTVHLVWANTEWEGSELMGVFECAEAANAYKLWMQERNSKRPEECDYQDDDAWLAAVEAWRKEDPESEKYEFEHDFSVAPMEVVPRALIATKEPQL